MLLLCTSSNSPSWSIPETANSVKLMQFHQGFFLALLGQSRDAGGDQQGPAREALPPSQHLGGCSEQEHPIGDGLGRCRWRTSSDKNPPAQQAAPARAQLAVADESQLPRRDRFPVWKSSRGFGAARRRAEIPALASMWFVLPRPGSWSSEVRGLRKVLSSGSYKAGYSREIRIECILHRIVGNKYLKDSTGIFFFFPRGLYQQ